MAEQKSFWKKYEFFIIAVITLLAIYLIVVFNQQINFLLGNELVIYLTPNQKSFSMNYGNASTIKFDVAISHFAYCKANCSYSFNDRSRNDIIDESSFNIEKKEHFTKSYELSVKRLGSGQDVYSFDVKCRSMRSFLCLTKSPEKTGSSLVTVNYDLTETEKKLKEILRQNITKLLLLLRETDALHQQANQKYFELARKTNLNGLSKTKIEIDDVYDKTRISIENLRSLWAVENYIKLNQLFNESLFGTLNDIKNSIADLNKEINSIVELHNNLLSQLNFLLDNLNKLKDLFSILGDSEAASSLSAGIKKFNELSSSITNNTFDSYDDLIQEINGAAKQQKSILEKLKAPAAELFFDSEYDFDYEKNLLCSLDLSCKENISVENLIKNSEEFLKIYPSTIPLKQNCNSLKILDEKYSTIRNETLGIIADKNMTFPLNNEFLALSDNFKENEIRKINNSYYGSFEKIKLENKTNANIIKVFSKILPANITDAKTLDYNQSINISLFLLSKINLSSKTLDILNKCSNFGKPIEAAEKIGVFNFEAVNPNITYKITSAIDTNLSDNPPICCIFNECKPCCRDDSCKNDPKTFPIIFVHGHSIAKDYSPEFSLDAFNKLQLKLQDDGYLNAGILLYAGERYGETGEWGMSGKPVSVRVSYYYDIYRKEDKYSIVPTKSESIDTYALRLNDVVDVVKEKTGKPKVNIIAFSMGGLVARKYIQIFGDGSVDKIITIGTPNKGIAGDAAGLCPILGESKECTDMQQNSLFLNKLNDPSKQPSNAKIYNIIGRGCLKNEKDGDGVVLSEHASLKGIKESKEFFVNGACSGRLGSFHTDLIDIEKHNETYKIIKEILKE